MTGASARRASLQRRVVLWLSSAMLVGTAGLAEAAATLDQIKREALLRGYTRQEAEARYKASLNTQITSTTAPAKGMAGALSGLAANVQRRINEQDQRYAAMWLQMENDLDVPVETQLQLEELKDLLDNYVDGNTNYNIAARRRLVNFALHQHRYAAHFFPQPDAERAAVVLRRNAYSAKHFYPWSAMTLAKLYLTGRGVPRDEDEALRLVTLCETAPPGNVDKPQTIPGDVVACLLMKAAMHRNGWGAPADEKEAARVERKAEDRYASFAGRRRPAAELAELFR